MGLAAGLLWLAAGHAAAADVPRIGRIVIDCRDVFDTSVGEEDRWVFRAANGLHVRTWETVLRRELLFREGDPYDPQLLRETERKLRGLSFLRSARVTPSAVHDGVVDVTIVTADAWTTTPEVSFSRTGGGNRMEFGFLERNLLGMGKQAEISYGEDPEGVERVVGYEDTQFGGRPIHFSFRQALTSQGTEVGGALSRPFDSSRVRYSAGVSGYYFRKDLPLYSGGAEIGTYRSLRRSFEAQIGRSLGSTSYRTRRLTLGYGYDESAATPLGGATGRPLPQDSRLGAVKLSYDQADQLYIQEVEVQRFDRVEDINLGFGYSISLGAGPSWLGSDEPAFLPRASVRMGWPWKNGFAILTNAYEQRLGFDGRSWQRLGRFDMQAYFRGLPRQTVAAHMGFQYGYRLQTDSLQLGESSGLRGYANDAFVGDRVLVASVEDRAFLAHDVLRLFSLGAAWFADTGYAWPSGDHVSVRDLRSCVGLGLRFAPSRSTSNEVVRVDAAYALNKNGQASRWVISLVSGYTFGF